MREWTCKLVRPCTHCHNTWAVRLVLVVERRGKEDKEGRDESDMSRSPCQLPKRPSCVIAFHLKSTPLSMSKTKSNKTVHTTVANSLRRPANQDSVIDAGYFSALLRSPAISCRLCSEKWSAAGAPSLLVAGTAGGGLRGFGAVLRDPRREQLPLELLGLGESVVVVGGSGGMGFSSIGMNTRPGRLSKAYSRKFQAAAASCAHDRRSGAFTVLSA
jgi:hypothetical protein